MLNLSERTTLEDDNFLTVVLSGVGEGRYRHLETSIVQVLYKEEYPSPRKIKRGDAEEVEEVEPHKLFEGRFFTDITRLPTKSFHLAWSRLLQYQVVESVGFYGDSLVYSSIEQQAERIRQRCSLSDEDYAYLTGLGQRVLLDS